MKVLAILQNQWFKDPERMKLMLANTFKGDRPRFIRTFLFWSCLTGKRLTSAFGEDTCDRIVWENASPEIGGEASSKFDADPAHVASVIDRERPDVVMGFGKIAAQAINGSVGRLSGDVWERITFIELPHPAARHATVMAELRAGAARLAELEGVEKGRAA